MLIDHSHELSCAKSFLHCFRFFLVMTVTLMICAVRLQRWRYALHLSTDGVSVEPLFREA